MFIFSFITLKMAFALFWFSIFLIRSQWSCLLLILSVLCVYFHPLAVFKLLFLLLFSGKVTIISHTFFMLIRLGTMSFSDFWIQIFPHIWKFSAINVKKYFSNVSSSETQLTKLILLTGHWVFVHFF